ncbi:MAG: chromosome segregation SMC family protein [Candidatus Pacearchaeota archaeon]
MPTYIKSLMMHGFKSFAKKTEIPFDRTLNIIIGPNGSGKSNITEAICFVLGRLSAKSLRAEKSSNFIYTGKHGSVEEALVELVFDNSDRTFAIDRPEVKISRIVRKNGNSIYKINDETKTRQEVLELLSQAGLDPNGFNIILQEEIAKFVEMYPEERRKIIEEVAGISIYEERKHKSLLELEKTEEKLKEVNTILNERIAYLRNLEKEREQALHHEKIKKAIERDKAALLFRQLEEKSKEDSDLAKKIEEKDKLLSKAKLQITELEEKIKKFNTEIEELNKQVEKSTGIEQEQLHKEVANEKAEIAALSVKHDNLIQRLQELEKRKEQLEKEVKNNLSEIASLKSSIPKEDLKKILKAKTEDFSTLEEKKERLDKLKAETIKIKSDLQNNKSNYESIIIRINDLQHKIAKLSEEIPKEKLENVLEKIRRSSFELNKFEQMLILSSNKIAELKKEIYLHKKLKTDIEELDICPVCRRKVTIEHIKEVHLNSDAEIEKLTKKVEQELELCSNYKKNIEKLKEELDNLKENAAKLKVWQINEKNLKERKEEKEKLEQEREMLSETIASLEKRLSTLNIEIKNYSDIEKNYYKLKEELTAIAEKDNKLSNLTLQIASKERDVETMQNIIKKSIIEKKELAFSISEIKKQLEEKQKILEEKEKQEKQIYSEFQKIFKKKASLQEISRQTEQKLVELRIETRSIEDEFNMLKIAKAKTNAELETLTNEFEQYKSFDIESLRLRQSKQEIEERIRKNEIDLAKIGSVNLKALEVYDKVKEQYDQIKEKVQKLESEKQEILNVITEIDKKKKKAFMKMFNDLNSKFSDYFLKLGGREASLILENKDDPFAGGIDIEVKLVSGKYLDVSSLSGGERTLVALSLIFAIQELKPYCFYILDEIDAALDKRNSERLAELLKTYMKNAQYIVVTHNDHLISGANTLYGVSMQEGISKVISLRV